MRTAPSPGNAPASSSAAGTTSAPAPPASSTSPAAPSSSSSPWASCCRSLGAEKLAQIKREFQAQCGVYGPDTAIGLVPNLLASRIANRLDLQGSAYTLDAACASALVAVDHACRELADGRSDLSLAGGVHLCHDLVFWSVFCQLGALSRTQAIRPFDRRADGLLMGEGIGMTVLKRLADARRDGDRIYAVIRGTGVASDGRDLSLMLPRVDGQVLALTRAWQMAGLEPGTVGLVEAHGTATPAGDAAELETLRRVFGPSQPGAERAVLGSVKSMIGHTMPAAGAAGLIKAALAAYHGVRPPSLHCEEPNPAIEATRFRVLAQAEPWEAGHRRAAVNAFGFGGINAHVVLEAHPEGRASRPESRGCGGPGGAAPRGAFPGRPPGSPRRRPQRWGGALAPRRVRADAGQAGRRPGHGGGGPCPPWP
ncbi:MAG: polyketide synthase [Holophagaceae bacterium]|nr:polyketide synthase [Holophagaceae bacterium]